MSYFESSSSESIQGEPRDYKKLYENERDIREHYQKKAQLMQIRLKKIMLAKHQRSSETEKRNCELIDQLKSFKIQIPKSPKLRTSISSRQTEAPKDIKYPLISNFAIYGISDSLIRDPEQNQNQIFEGQTLFTSGAPSEIVMHSAKLVFPSGASFKKYFGEKARKKCVEIMSRNYNTVRSFILSFQPPEGQTFYGGRRTSKDRDTGETFLNQINSEKRMYAVCFSVPQYTWIDNRKDPIDFSLQNIDQSYQEQQSNFVKNAKSISCAHIDAILDLDQDLCLGISERIYCFFTHYPVFSFFQEVLKSLVNLVKMERLVLYKQNENLAEADSSFHLRRMKQLYYSCVEKVGSLTTLKINEIYEIKLINLQKVCLYTDFELVKKKYVSEWIYPILKLFTVDKFIQIFTLIMLQERLVFVCENAHILTYMVYLFTNILPKPFYYPYPVVTIIPDQEEFLNVPFPVVYGYLNNRNSIMEENLHKIFRNVYVFVNNDGIQVVSADSRKVVLGKRSPKLREKLVPWFEKLNLETHSKLKRHSKLQFSQSKDFDFTYSRKGYETSMIILQEVSHYIESEIHSNIPTNLEVQRIRKALIKDLGEDQDVTHEVYKKIVSTYQKRSKDPFFQQFLHTQLLNVHIFQ